jgi:hypothetical protein
MWFFNGAILNGRSWGKAVVQKADYPESEWPLSATSSRSYSMFQQRLKGREDSFASYH